MILAQLFPGIDWQPVVPADCVFVCLGASALIGLYLMLRAGLCYREEEASKAAIVCPGDDTPIPTARGEQGPAQSNDAGPPAASPRRRRVDRKAIAQFVFALFLVVLPMTCCLNPLWMFPAGKPHLRDRITPGMTAGQVREVLGSPTGRTVYPDRTESWYYKCDWFDTESFLIRFNSEGRVESATVVVQRNSLEAGPGSV